MTQFPGAAPGWQGAPLHHESFAKAPLEPVNFSKDEDGRRGFRQMAEIEQDRFTVAVFQDVQWAKRGLDALARHGFPPEALTVMAKESVETAALIQETFGTDGGKLDLHGIGPVVAHGPLVDALQGSKADLGRTGVAAAIRRVGFQDHDGYIFETLTARGGVLVAIRTEPRAADALAVLHAYGGGNAAIGAWTGRV